MGVSEELSRLAALRDQGVLSADEFEAQKAKVLSEKPSAVPIEPSPKPKLKLALLGCLGTVVALFLLLVVIGAIAGEGSDETTGSTTTTSNAPDPEATANAPEDDASNRLTMSQRNAARSARSYLEMSGFSRKGLIHQLSSEAGEGYSDEDAAAAVDSLDVDWNENAAKSAKQYLGMSGFSCKGLVHQLSSSAGEGYTTDQATYGAREAGAC